MFILAIIVSSILAPRVYATVCSYIVGGSFIGELDHCYTVSFGSGVVYSRSYCVYSGTTTPEGISFDGTMEIPYEQANQC
mgnify:CR=1 FL=1